jgi:NADPH-dependent curcumin reductase CurA
MSATMARQIILVARPQRKPRLTDFRLEETQVPTLGAGELLLEVQYLSLDPYMRGRMDDRKSYATYAVGLRYRIPTRLHSGLRLASRKRRGTSNWKTTRASNF